MNSAEFLDRVRAEHGLSSDYQVAKKLDIPISSMSGYRTGRREFDDATSIKIAVALGEAPLYVIATINVGRAKCPEVRDVWEYLAKVGKSIRAKGTAMAMAFVVLGGLGAPSLAEAASAVNSNGPEYTLYAYRRRLRSWLRGLLGRFANRIAAGIYPVSVLIAVIAIVSLAGCAASPAEKAWQAMHLVDVAQTLNGPARDPRFVEMRSAGMVLGERPSVESVIAWGVAMAIGHYAVDRWLTRTGRADRRGWRALRYLDLGYKGFVIGANHACGIRPFGDNKHPKCWAPGWEPWLAE